VIGRGLRTIVVRIHAGRVPQSVLVTTSDDPADATGRRTRTLVATPTTAALGVPTSVTGAHGPRLRITSCAAYCVAIPVRLLRRYVYVDAIWSPPPGTQQVPSNVVWVLRRA
jgi:hypothetical protein